MFLMHAAVWAERMRKQYALEVVSSRLQKASIPYHLTAGTALGAHREGDFIAHDHDIDLAVFTDEATVNDVASALYGLKFQWCVPHEVSAFVVGVPVDVFMVTRGQGDTGHTQYCNTDMGMVSFETSYDLERIQFRGRTYSVPDKGYLAQQYGPDWKTPKRFGHFNDAVRNGEYHSMHYVLSKTS